MKYLVFTYILLLYQNKEVGAGHSFLEFLNEQLGYVQKTITTTVANLKNMVIKYFIPNNDPKAKFIALKKNSKPFTNFVEEADRKIEGPEFTHLKYKPTAFISTPHLASFHGRRMETHSIYSKDGYLLTLHRVISADMKSRDTNLTVLLHHGLLGSSADWILLGSEKSLPYLLMDAGYDVWLANARGNYYSRGHATKDVESAAFWKFTWQEMGQIDLAAVIDYIRFTKKTDLPIDFIGHSMGATALLVLLSSAPRYNDYLRIGILLAPIAFMSNSEGPLKVMAIMATNPPQQLVKIIGPNEFFPSRRLPKSIAMKYCKGSLLFCCNPLYFITGGIPEDKDFDVNFVARLMYHVPAGTSTNTILHYAQLIKSGKFHRFNNVNSEFPLSHIRVPIALISSSDDCIATVPDILRLYFSIQNPIDHYIVRGMKLGHNDFVWGKNAPYLVFSKIIEFLDNNLTYVGNQVNEIHADMVLK